MEDLKIKFMRRAMELAERGRGHVNPNPLVGAVIVRDGSIIAEGWHQRYGEAHAEVNAFRDADEKGVSVKGAEMYVTLEPCSHYGKTPPCAEAIIKRGISKVYVGLKDPNPLVSGKGIKMIEEAGIEVESGFLEDELKRQNEVFLSYIVDKKPFCVVKTAMSLDGKIAAHTGDSKWISNEKSRRYVHRLRHDLMGIMVGVNTVIKDNPSLNTRLEADEVYGGPSDTIKIVVDSRARIPLDSKLLNSGFEKVIVAVTEAADQERIEAIVEKGAEVLIIDQEENFSGTKSGRVDIGKLMERLGELKIDSVLIEGGGTLNFSAFKSGIADKVVSFIAPKIIGGRDALTPVEGDGIGHMCDAFQIENLEIERFDEDIMITGYVKK